MNPVNFRTVATPITEPSVDKLMDMLPKGTPEYMFPLSARGGLMGVFGLGPNPARERIEKENENG